MLFILAGMPQSCEHKELIVVHLRSGSRKWTGSGAGLWHLKVCPTSSVRLHLLNTLQTTKDHHFWGTKGWKTYKPEWDISHSNHTFPSGSWNFHAMLTGVLCQLSGALFLPAHFWHTLLFLLQWGHKHFPNLSRLLSVTSTLVAQNNNSFLS